MLVQCVRKQKKKRKENLSRKTAKVNLKQPGADALDADYVATTVKNSVSADLCMMGAVY